MKSTNSSVLRASIKRILITTAFIITLIILIGFITISYVVGNSIVEPVNKQHSYSQTDSTLLIIKSNFHSKINHFNRKIDTIFNNKDHD